MWATLKEAATLSLNKHSSGHVHLFPSWKVGPVRWLLQVISDEVNNTEDTQIVGAKIIC